MFTRIFGLGTTSAAALRRFEFIIWLTMRIRLTELNPKTESDSDWGFGKSQPETLTIVRYAQNSIGRSLAFDVRLGVLESHPLCNANAISLSASIVGLRTTRKDAVPLKTRKKCIEH